MIEHRQGFFLEIQTVVLELQLPLKSLNLFLQFSDPALLRGVTGLRTWGRLGQGLNAPLTELTAPLLELKNEIVNKLFTGVGTNSLLSKIRLLSNVFGSFYF